MCMPSLSSTAMDDMKPTFADCSICNFVQEEAEVQEEEHVAYLKAYVFFEVLLPYAMCNVSLESTAISA